MKKSIQKISDMNVARNAEEIREREGSKEREES
jgi:hypothetical protein